MTTTDTSCVLAIDLGTSRVKVSVVDDSLDTRSSSVAPYASIRDEAQQSEQRTDDWIIAIARATHDALASVDVIVAAVVLTAQMPTLVALSSAGSVLGNAVTWQDSRADQLVLDSLSVEQRRRVAQVAGTPIDGRYVIPMHLRRGSEIDYQPEKILSAKDYLYFVLTGEFVTDPSTASGFGSYDLEARTWSDELCRLWNVPATMLPVVVEPTFARPLSANGARMVPGVRPGTPVIVGAADSVCAHHFVTRTWPDAVSVIDGSSTVIVASLENILERHHDLLNTPLVDVDRVGVELDLLATGTSIGWMAGIVGVSEVELEEMALEQGGRTRSDALVFPYFAGGEQGALWRSDVTGVITGLTHGTTRQDLALALFEGIAFETWRCVDLVRTLAPASPVVALTAKGSHRLVPSLLRHLLSEVVVAMGQTSPSILGAALIAFKALDRERIATSVQGAVGEPLVEVDPSYASSLAAKARRYFASGPVTSLNRSLP